MYRSSACGLYTYILALEIHDGSAYRPFSGGLCTYIRAPNIRDCSACRPSSRELYTCMRIYVHTYSIAFSANCLAPGDSVVGVVESRECYVVLIGAFRWGLAVAVFTVGASGCMLAGLCWMVCAQVPHVVLVGDFHLGVGWHVDVEPSLGLVGCSPNPRALARVPVHFLA